MGKSYYDKVLESVDRTPISSIDIDNAINLSIGEPHYGISDEIIVEIEKSLKAQETGYNSPQGITQLRKAYLDRISNDFSTDVGLANIMIGAGVSNLLNLVFTSVLSPKDCVVLIEPYYFSYLYLLKQYNVFVEFIPESFSEFDLYRIKRKVKLILFSNPSNPSGYCMKKSQINLLVEFAGKNDALIVSDEIYHRFVYDGEFTSMGSVYKNTCTLDGFSKSHSMTGLRLGVALGPEWLIERMVEYQTHSLICVPTCIQKGGIVALNIDIDDKVKQYKRNRDRLYDAITKRFYCNKPQGGFYLFFDSQRNEMDFINALRKKCDIIATPGSLFTRHTTYVRLAFCVSEEKIDLALRRLEKEIII